MELEKHSPVANYVNLRTATTIGEWCGSCKYFVADCDTCQRVCGQVEDSQYCDLFTQRDPGDDFVVTLPAGDTELDPSMVGDDEEDALEAAPDYPYEAYAMSKDAAEIVISMSADDGPDKGQVFGWANVSVKDDGETIVDAHGDEIPIEELENAAYGHVLEFRATGQSHVGGITGRLIESVVYTPEKIKAMGLQKDAVPQGWWVGYQIDDPDVWAGVKSGKFRAFSVQGIGQYEDGGE